MFKVAVLPEQIAATVGTVGADGLDLIVTADVVLEQLVVLAKVKVKVAEPAKLPVTTPASVTVAIRLLLLFQVPPVVGERVVVEFTQIDELPVILTAGNALTFNWTVFSV